MYDQDWHVNEEEGTAVIDPQQEPAGPSGQTHVGRIPKCHAVHVKTAALCCMRLNRKGQQVEDPSKSQQGPRSKYISAGFKHAMLCML